MDGPPPELQCSYPNCLGFPEGMKEKCQKCTTSFLQHLCQTAYESVYCQPNNIDLGLQKNCYPCLLKVIEEEKKRLGLPVGIVETQTVPPETTIPDESIPPMPPLLTQPAEHESSNSIPTNVAPTRADFQPPGEIETPT